MTASGYVHIAPKEYAAIYLDGNDWYARRRRMQRELLEQLKGPQWWPVDTTF